MPRRRSINLPPPTPQRKREITVYLSEEEYSRLMSETARHGEKHRGVMARNLILAALDGLEA